MPTRTSAIKQDQSAQVVSGHLPSGYTADYESLGERAQDRRNDGEQESSLRLQGGDIHRDLFKLGAPSRQLHHRAATYSHPRASRTGSDSSDRVTASHHQTPGGFRRQFLQNNSEFIGSRLPVTRNFVEFLNLYGSFAGEDLAESDDESIQDESNEDEQTATERRPLLGPRGASRTTVKGDSGMLKSFFTLLKAFIGTGVLFLPRAFLNGGLLFSSLALVIVALVTMLAFHLLLQCRKYHGGGGFGELGLKIAGPKMRSVILGSITISQLGFVCACVVFVAENLHAFLEAVIRGRLPLSIPALIALQLIILVPLSFIRNISKLGPAALLADVFILIGVVYIYYYDIATISIRGIHPTVRLFNPEHFTLTIGNLIFSFEGIGLILPIQSSMAKPQKFEHLLAIVMLIITILFTSVGALCYATFGSDTNIEVLSNFPQDSRLVNAVQFLYAMAVLIGAPVQLFPALRIIEGKLFAHKSGKNRLLIKWKKNTFRTGLVLLCVAISIAGASNLDRFVALIGSFACIPLVYIYPPFLHLQGVAQSKFAKIGDVAFMVLGFGAMIYTTSVTIANSF
ncbi:vacuolar amino acid transporter 3 [Myriangium duriaei CBS 260.36]|uniref:Vacuolar amino acid transporter 3 n=1 Tax=Myriangium duriaei CBS 260.36 TaxID=1168546 RepID=A0A9P4IYP6_9PEZI|nr:vacuolar amino acid transporter 3 [Myriangium duriaei CBS 260.36]